MIRPDSELKKVAENTIYARRLEGGCLKQFNDCLSQRGVLYGALMPDAHQGYSAPIGSALITGGIIYPEWVGYDVGCGILSVPTSFKVEDIKKNARAIFRDIHWKSPINNKIINPVALPKYLQEGKLSKLGRAVFKSEKCLGFTQLGTLGGGNHFVEIGVDLTGMVWISVHSGSRGTGHQIADAHIKLANALNTEGDSVHPGFTIRSMEAQAYLNDMAWLLGYASINRHRIFESVIGIIQDTCEGVGYSTGGIESNHNHIEVTNNNYIHRKGCTQADKGEMVNVGSNMRDGIYLCRGKGEHDAAYSCAHGAGRYCSRTQVKKALDIETFEKDMKGIMCTVSEKYIDESPKAYKDMGTVLEQQEDLISIIGHIEPIINIKN